MVFEKAILAIITTNKEKVTGGAPIFICEDFNELQKSAANLEAILDGIAHALSEEVFIIVKH
ncbi:capping complex subunit for YIEGIA [Ornithinibacillus sp. 179-J 7C1 HS]|uniref:capping complex subunit for YIEGIA n=1 Tax=Ornithinibacillus sp. 179-J 7C1 HS TaxID=3142384 RepID=UPI0039A203C1